MISFMGKVVHLFRIDQWFLFVFLSNNVNTDFKTAFFNAKINKDLGVFLSFNLQI